MPAVAPLHVIPDHSASLIPQEILIAARSTSITKVIEPAAKEIFIAAQNSFQEGLDHARMSSSLRKLKRLRPKNE
jgi:hypothetical protein